ncbi:hypothetical protein BsIDN1_60820 [Bacillus safensis]|uniref:Carbonic anhydrase n=1 Tax=Bacillus safensis TaxID=561879 RepID=A0A5S9MJV6_BACIA|nr:hypothetical protein BsIDN1_60820 [Bacillus safensis]
MGDGKMESKLEQILRHNSEFVNKRHYEPYKAGKFPEKKLVILTCMDTRLFGIIAAIYGTAQRGCKNH